MDKLHLDQHISREFNEELEQVRDDLITMARLAVGLLRDSMAALLAQDAARGRELDLADDAIDDLECSIDEECQRIIARRQPAATDLRLLISVLKNSTDLERIGDEAQKLARMAVRRGTDLRQPLPQTGRLQALAEAVTEALEDSIRALETFDAELAFRLHQNDRQIDAAYRELVAASIRPLTQSPEDVLDLVAAARALERIGDHVCNICEQLIYLLGGEDVRHLPLAEVAEVVRRASEREQ